MRKVKPSILAAIIAVVAFFNVLFAAFRFDDLETKTVDFLGHGPPALSASGNGRMYFDNVSNAFFCSENGGAFRLCGAMVAGSDTQVQYNLANNFGADANFIWDYTAQIFKLSPGGSLGLITLGGAPLASMGTPADGTWGYCTDCTKGTIPCTTGGSGSDAVRLAGSWTCGGGGGGGGTPGLPFDSIQFNAAGSFAGNTDYGFEAANPTADSVFIHTSNLDNTLAEFGDTALTMQMDSSAGAGNAYSPITALNTAGPNISGPHLNTIFANGILTTLTIKGAPSAPGSLATGIEADLGSSGYTPNAGTTIAGYFTNAADSGSSTLSLGSSSAMAATIGTLAHVVPGGSPSSYSIGSAAEAAGSTALQIGLLGKAWDAGPGGNSIAVLGNAFDTGGGVGATIGGYFTLYGTLNSTISSALIVDGNGTNEIIARNAGTQNFKIDSAGGITYNGPLLQTGYVNMSTNLSGTSTDRTIRCTSGSSTDKTYTAVAATGSGRVIDIRKIDNGTKACIFTVPSGALNSGTTVTLGTQWYRETCQDDASGVWFCSGNGTIT